MDGMRKVSTSRRCWCKLDSSLIVFVSVGDTVLDLAREQVRRLREWKAPTVSDPILKTNGLEEALSEFQEGTWQHAAAKTQISRTKRLNETKVANFEREKAHLASLELSIQMRQEAIDSAIVVFEQIEEEIIAKGGKTFRELHPGCAEPRQNHSQSYRQQGRQESLEFKVDFSFCNINDLTERRRAKYIEL